MIFKIYKTTAAIVITEIYFLTWSIFIELSEIRQTECPPKNGSGKLYLFDTMTHTSGRAYLTGPVLARQYLTRGVLITGSYSRYSLILQQIASS